MVGSNQENVCNQNSAKMKYGVIKCQRNIEIINHLTIAAYEVSIVYEANINRMSSAVNEMKLLLQ
jgi:hypothetical protein